jgi:hypothetical protein
VSRRAALGLLLLCALLRSVSLFRPCLSDDEATYATVGREMLAGQGLYKDVVDHKPPAIYVVNELTQAIGGPTTGMLLLHGLLIVVVWATGLILARLAGRDDRRLGMFAALMWVVFTTTLFDCDSLAANCELFMMLPLAASAYVFVRSGPSMARLPLAGGLVGVAILFKYQAGIQLVFYAVAWLVSCKSVARRFAGVAALAGGAVVPLAVAIAWLAANGALADAWFWLRFNFSYIAAGSNATFPAMLTRAGFAVLAAAPLYWLALKTLRNQPRSPFWYFILGWIVASAAAITVGGRFFGHYFHQLTAPLAVLAAPAAAELWHRRQAIFTVLLAVPATIFFVLGVEHDAIMELAGEPDPDYASVAAWLDAHGRPSDSLCIWGNSPVLYFEAARPLGCRFVFANYITGSSPATSLQTDPHVDASRYAVPEAWPMMEHDLTERRPTFIVDASPGDVGYYGKFPPSAFPLGAILARDYAPEATVAGMRIYRRCNQQSRSCSSDLRSAATPRRRATSAAPIINSEPAR